MLSKNQKTVRRMFGASSSYQFLMVLQLVGRAKNRMIEIKKTAFGPSMWSRANEGV